MGAHPGRLLRRPAHHRMLGDGARPGGSCLTATCRVTATFRVTAGEREPHAVTTYTRMQEELRTAITAAVLTVVWAPIRDQLNAGCGGKLSGLNGRTVFLQPWATEGSVTVEQWPTVVAAMVPVAAAYKFTGPRAARVAGSEFRSEFQGPYGALLELSSFKAMVMMVQTGCHPES